MYSKAVSEICDSPCSCLPILLRNSEKSNRGGALTEPFPGTVFKGGHFGDRLRPDLYALLSEGAEVNSATRYGTRYNHNHYRSPLGILAYGPACGGSSRALWRIKLGILERKTVIVRKISYHMAPSSPQYVGLIDCRQSHSWLCRLSIESLKNIRVVEEHANSAAVT